MGMAARGNAVSKTINVVAVNDKPLIGAFDTAISYQENAIPTWLDIDAAVVDVDSSNFDTGQTIGSRVR